MRSVLAEGKHTGASPRDPQVCYDPGLPVLQVSHTMKTFRCLLFACLSTSLLAMPLRAAEESGRELFLSNCAECHQRDGQGLNNVYPALAGSETVRGSGADVALVLMIGRGEMPSFKDALSSQEMAAIINYVRNSWGNSGSLISPEQVEALR